MNNKEQREYVVEFLNDHKFLALATVWDSEPFCCNLHYGSDDEGNIYFASKHARKHSINITEHSEVALCIYDHESGDTVVSGIQVKWICTKCGPNTISQIIQIYRNKFPGKWKEIDDLVQNDGLKSLYKVTPKRVRIINGYRFDKPQELDW